MKKFKNLMLVLALVVAASLSINVAYAQESNGEFECEFERKVFYEDETINMTWKMAEDYATEDKKITDFEMQLAVGTKIKEWTGLKMIPVLENATFSTDVNKLYYIQVASMAQKRKLNGGDVIATAKATVRDEMVSTIMFKEDDAEMELDIAIKLDGKAYRADETNSIIKERYNLKLVAYEVGDFTRDHEVDFFDITALISEVYDNEGEELDWRKRLSITSNTKNYSDASYDFKTAELGFMDIIYLIRNIYG